MEQELNEIRKQVSFLKWMLGILTVVLAIIILAIFIKPDITHFKEISAERINIVEDNGKLRLVISNKSRSPEVLAYGKPYVPAIPGHNRPGLFFYNDEGTENGGLVFMGHKDSSGKYVATGHLSFDQYNQNQVLYLTYADENGAQNTGLHIDDWQTDPPFWLWRKDYINAEDITDSVQRQKQLAVVMEPKPGQKAFAQRVFVGKDDNKSALVTLSDRMGNPRLQLMVDSNGLAKLNFLDEQGRITYSVPGK